MKEFTAYWKNYVNFSDRTSRRGYWMAFLFLIIATIIVTIVSVIGDAAGFLPAVMTVPLMDDPMLGTIEVVYNVLDVVWFLALIIPSLSIAVRRLRDIGKRWPWLFINFIPLVGSIWFIVLLCTRSVADDGTPVV